MCIRDRSDDGSSVIILDQSRLPMHTEYIEINKPAEMYDAIFHLKVRGAPAIGIFAAYCMAVIAKKAAGRQADRESAAEGNVQLFTKKLREYGEYIKSSRPTAVNLAWAVDRTLAAAGSAENGTTADIAEAVKNEALSIHLSLIHI